MLFRSCWGGWASTPTAVTGIDRVIDVAVAAYNGILVRRDIAGDVQLWEGWTLDGSTFREHTQCLASPCSAYEAFENPTVIGAGGRHCALHGGGAVHCWDDWPAIPDPIASGATDLTAGGTHACAIVGGLVRCWGANNVGQLGDGTMTTSVTPVTVLGLSDVRRIVADPLGTMTYAFVGDARTLWHFGARMEGGDWVPIPAAPVGLDDVVDVSAGYGGPCVVHSTGRVTCRGTGKLLHRVVGLP